MKNRLNVIKKTPRTRFLFFLASDVIAITLALYASFFVRFDFTLPHQYRPSIPYYTGITLFVLLPLLYLKRLYHFTWIYVSLNTLISLMKAVTYGFLFLGLLLFLARNHSLAINLPRSIILIDYVLVVLLVGGLRISKRLFYELFLWKSTSHKTADKKPRILIIGAGDGAEQLIRSIKQNKHYPFELVGILDDSNIKQNTAIHGIPVLGKIENLQNIKDKKNIYGIIIAIPSATASHIQHIVSSARSAGINYTKTLPSLTEFTDHRVTIKDVRDIKVDDLLGREKIDVSFKEIEELIKEKTVLITGAAGSIGEELVWQVHKFNPQKLICLDTDETRLFDLKRSGTEPVRNGSVPLQLIVGNILDKEKIERLFATHKPHIVLHAAAYKHVGMMEKAPEEAVETNIVGTWNVAEASAKHGAEKFVLISTDKAVNPTSVMGMSKRIAEMLVMGYNGVAVRFGNVLGSRGSVVPIFTQQIMSGGPVTITHQDMERYFMVPSEAILLVLQASYLGRGGEIFVLDMGKPVKIVTLAETMIKMAGFEPYRDIPIIFTQPEEGEKFYETLMTNTEQMDSTKHKKIFIAKPDDIKNKTAFLKQVEYLIALAKEGKRERIKEKMAEMVLFQSF